MGLSNSITAALLTRFGLHVSTIRKYLKHARIEEWGKVQRIDSDVGDLVHSSGLMKPTADHRDATFVRVSHAIFLVSQCSALSTHDWELLVCDVSGSICTYAPLQTRARAPDLLRSA